MGNNGRFLVPYRDLRDRGWHKAFWVIDATLKDSIVVDGGNGEAQGRRGQRHCVGTFSAFGVSVKRARVRMLIWQKALVLALVLACLRRLQEREPCTRPIVEQTVNGSLKYK